MANAFESARSSSDFLIIRIPNSSSERFGVDREATKECTEYTNAIFPGDNQS
jgi:hypothetical protein